MAGCYRFVICVDVEADSLEDAYSVLVREMKKVDRYEFQWESTDEVFDPDGESIDAETVHQAIAKQFTR